jgi:hypothetical protein
MNIQNTDLPEYYVVPIIWIALIALVVVFGWWVNYSNKSKNK